VGVLSWAGFSRPSSAAAPDPASPRAVIDSVVTQVLSILRDPKLSINERREKIKGIAYQNMDFETLSRLALGRYWRDLNAAQQTQFVEEFKKHLSNTYGHTFDNYHNEDVKVTGDRQESPPPATPDWTVLTHIVGDKNVVRQELAKVAFRMRRKEEWKIIDVTVDGVSLVANFRAQFTAIMAKGGIDQLLKLLREKNATGDIAR
jgi:phospholipid transport system substrate-binding protein